VNGVSTCPEWEGFICFYNGVSDNWKVCSDTSCPYTPDLPKVPSLDHCDVTQQALDAGDETDKRASIYCEYKVRVDRAQ